MKSITTSALVLLVTAVTCWQIQEASQYFFMCDPVKTTYKHKILVEISQSQMTDLLCTVQLSSADVQQLHQMIEAGEQYTLAVDSLTADVRLG